MRETEALLLELTGRETGRLRKLWEQVFTEDSETFLDYYFSHKAPGSRALALERKGTGHICSMLFLTPYPVRIKAGGRFLERTASYIVGVATEPDCRHRGYMDRLLRRALSLLSESGQPFTFLMPAHPDIYRPYQFTYVYDRPQWDWCPEDFPEDGEWTLRAVKPGELSALSAYAQEELERRQQVYIRRDEEYFRTMTQELAAENGAVYLLHRRDDIRGYLFYAEEERPYVQEIVASEEAEALGLWPVRPHRQPIIMARIVNLTEMLSLLRAKKGEAELELLLRVTDPILRQNEGCFEWRLSETEASVRRIPFQRQDAEPLQAAQLPRGDSGVPQCECTISIERLTAWIFGYEPAEKCFDACSKEELCKLNNIQTLKNVWLNEIV